LVAATTRISMLSSPFRSRFSGGTFRLNFYTKDEVAKILKRSAKILGISAAAEALDEIASRSRSTPRTANYLLKRCRDYAQLHGGKMDVETVRKALSLLEVDELGLTKTDREILDIIINKFNGGPVGLKTLSASISEEEETIEEVNEPYLMQLGLLERTPRGRKATPRAYRHLGIDSKNEQDRLI